MKRQFESIRLQNLEQLIHEAGSAVELARLCGTNSSYISQVRRQMPTKNGTPRGVGPDLAAKLEVGMGKPEGWMDEPHGGEPHTSRMRQATGTGIGSSTCILHPLISWAEAGERPNSAEDNAPDRWNEWLPCPVKCSEKTFVLRAQGASMEPKFPEGTLIFVDPEIEPAHGKYIVVNLGNADQATFKQLIVEDDHRFLKALNPDWPKPIVEMDEAATITGVVVFKGEQV